MPNATVRANARTTSKPKPPPGPAASIRRKTAELKSATALLKAAKVVQQGKPNAMRDLLGAVDELHTVRRLLEAAQMATHDIEGGEAAPMDELLGVILGRLKAVTDKIDAVRPKPEGRAA